jgi:hypothetical protein
MVAMVVAAEAAEAVAHHRMDLNQAQAVQAEPVSSE